MKEKPTALKTKRLTLSPLSSAALEKKRDAQTDVHMKQAYSEKLEGVKADPEHAVWHTEWVICRKEDGAVVGGIGFRGAPQNKTVEISFFIDAPYRGNGYASEALKSICEWAFMQPDAYFIRAAAEEGNTAALHVLSKNGFLPPGEGQEGWRYELERPKSSWMAIYMSIGMSMGVALGLPFDNLALGICLGMGMGVALGLALDAQDKKARMRSSEKKE
jgi:ribosomal-protein-alanine N-acetyltransferase